MNSDTEQLEIKDAEIPTEVMKETLLTKAEREKKLSKNLSPMIKVYKNIIKNMKIAQGLKEEDEFFKVLHPISNYMSTDDMKVLPLGQQNRIITARSRRLQRKQRNIELAKKGAFYEKGNF